MKPVQNLLTRKRVILFTLVLAWIATGLFIYQSTRENNTNNSVRTDESVADSSSRYNYQAVIPTKGTPSGQYGGEFKSSPNSNQNVNVSNLPYRPYVGTETYWINTSVTQEKQWLKDLKLDMLRIEVLADDVEKGNDDSNPNTDFTNWTKANFESGKGWTFNKTDTQTENNVNNATSVVKYPFMMMMHYGGESYMGQIPNSEEYAEYFLATVYYYNVIRGMNIKYWEVLNEPDYEWSGKRPSPAEYAEIFKKVATRIKNHPDSRVNSISLGGPVMGSGDPIIGTWPDGFANATSAGDDGREWSKYIPTLLASGSRSGKHDIGFVSWHDYGDRLWGDPNNLYYLDKTYSLVNRVNHFYSLTDSYTSSGGERPKMIISEMNLDAGTTDAPAKEAYKSFYAPLWHTSALNNYFSTGKVEAVFHFYWKGTNNWPKGLVYQDSDSGGKLVRNPVWFLYYEYIRHTQEKILASYSGRIDPWADAIVTTDNNGKMINMIAVNKSDSAKEISFDFNVPESFLGNVWVSKKIMTAGGDTNANKYGSPFAEPVISNPYQFQAITLSAGKKLAYKESIPARTIVFYTLVNEAGGSTPPPAPTSVCGNGNIETGEVCDDSNTSNNDQCSNDCKNKCTAPQSWDGSTCVSPTTPPPNVVCGNGNVETGEVCDDSNTSNNDQCSSDCKNKCTSPQTWNGSACVSPTTPPPSSTSKFFGPTSPFNKPIPNDATYTKENRIGSFRQVYEVWSMPIYRINKGETHELVKVVNKYSNRTVYWPIPKHAKPAAEDDAHLGVIDYNNNVIYEFWDAQWNSSKTQINAGGMKDFPFADNGISNPTNQRVNAAGFSTISGMVIKEDLLNPNTGQLDANMRLKHSLAMALPIDVVYKNGYVPPAVGGEKLGKAGSSGIPMGALFAIPKNVNVDNLNIHPMSKIILNAVRDYGVYINDGNNSTVKNGKYNGTIRIEPGLSEELFGVTSDSLITKVEADITKVITDYGIYRITGGTTTPTNPVCNNGIIETDEVCDGNSTTCTVNGYAGTKVCTATCSGFGTCVATERCGDGTKNGAEVCDDGNTNNNDQCSSSCANKCTAPQVWNGTTCVTTSVTPKCKADYNADGIVNIIDFAIFATNYAKTGIDCKYDLVGNDCKLNGSDFGDFASKYNNSTICKF